jgi:hypothetical protein
VHGISTLFVLFFKNLQCVDIVVDFYQTILNYYNYYNVIIKF